MEENYQVKQVITRYENEGIDAKAIEIAKKDLKRGVGLDVVDIYMNPRLYPDIRLALADAIHKGLPVDLAKKISDRDRNIQKEVLSHADGSIPYKVLEEIMDSCTSMNQARVSFRDYMEEVQRLQTEKRKNEEPEKTVNMDFVQKNHIPATAPMEEEKPEPEKKKPVHTVFDSKPEPAPEPEVQKPQIPEVQIEKESIPQAPERQADLYNKLVHLMEEMIDVNRKALDAVVTFKDKGASVDPVPRYVPNAFEKKDFEKRIEREEKKDTGDEILDRVEVSKDAAFRPFKDKYKRETENTVQESVPERRQSPARPASPYLNGYMQMVMLPNGRIRPITIEYTPKPERKGFVGFVSRIFGKGSTQESLVKQLIDRKMSAPQLKIILRAVRERLESEVIHDLVNSDLPAVELDNIVDVAIEERNRLENEEMNYNPFAEVE